MVNFIRIVGEMDSPDVTLWNSPLKISPGIHQKNGWLWDFTRYVGVIQPNFGVHSEA